MSDIAQSRRSDYGVRPGQLWHSAIYDVLFLVNRIGDHEWELLSAT